MENEESTVIKKEKGSGALPVWARLLIAVLLLAVGALGGYVIFAMGGTAQSPAIKPAAPTSAAVISLPKAETPVYIGTVAAKQAALKHAKLQDLDATFYSITLEKENGIMVYDIDFSTDAANYEYEINALTGDVEGWKLDKLLTADTGKKVAQTVTDAAGAVTDKIAQAGSNLPNVIDETTAEAAALQHAGFTEAEVSRMKCKLELDGLNLEYDVEFTAYGAEYSYEIDAITGQVIGFEKEKD